MKPTSAINIINLFINYAEQYKKGMKIKINIIMCWVMLLNVAFGRVHTTV